MKHWRSKDSKVATVALQAVDAAAAEAVVVAWEWAEECV